MRLFGDILAMLVLFGNPLYFDFPAFCRLLGHDVGIIICLLGVAVFITNGLSFNQCEAPVSTGG